MTQCRQHRLRCIIESVTVTSQGKSDCRYEISQITPVHQNLLSYNRVGHVNYIPTYCNFSQEFPEILSQNQIYIYTLSFTECLGNPKYCIVGYSLTCPIVLCHNSIDHCHILACPQHKARVSGVGSRTSMFPSERVNLPERAEWNYTCSPLSRSDKSTHSVGNILVLGGWVGGENDEIWWYFTFPTPPTPETQAKKGHVALWSYGQHNFRLTSMSFCLTWIYRAMKWNALSPHGNYP